MKYNSHAENAIKVRTLSISFLVTGLLALPWLNPIVYGPTPSVLQWLIAWSAGALSWLLMQSTAAGSRAKVQIVIFAWITAALLSAVIGMLQYLGLSGHLGGLVSYVEAGQAYANLRQRNQLATLLSIGIASLVCVMSNFQNEGIPSFNHQWKHGVWVGSSILLAATDAATGSRTGLIQMLLLLALAVIWKRGRRIMALVAIAYLLSAYLLPLAIGIDPLSSTILGRLREAAAPCTSRLTLWANVLGLIAQRPWLGWGWGELAYAHFMNLYPGPRFCEILGNAHNLPLHLAVSFGVPFALAICGGVTWGLIRAKPWREKDPTRQLAWSVLAVIGLHSMLEYPLWYGPFQLAAILAIWILCIYPSFKSVRSPLLIAMAVVMIAACGYGAWDYRRISQIYLPLTERAPEYRDETLKKAGNSWLFHQQVEFAELGITSVDQENLKYIYGLALELLHFSPEAMVVEKLIESAQLLGNVEEAKYFTQRYKVAYPQDYERWKNSSRKTEISNEFK